MLFEFRKVFLSFMGSIIIESVNTLPPKLKALSSNGDPIRTTLMQLQLPIGCLVTLMRLLNAILHTPERALPRGMDDKEDHHPSPKFRKD
ncbi:unnamed protein product [Euphydryas editha]|uniref:Uncharacterized protein n=1 Tax=Euphydryas editha TaxID=104508 RepID=A0AAU9THS8_EUPED|nr:unnamed protein product [Euphydryas editha]